MGGYSPPPGRDFDLRGGGIRAPLLAGMSLIVVNPEANGTGLFGKMQRLRLPPGHPSSRAIQDYRQEALDNTSPEV